MIRFFSHGEEDKLPVVFATVASTSMMSIVDGMDRVQSHESQEQNGSENDSLIAKHCVFHLCDFSEEQAEYLYTDCDHRWSELDSVGHFELGHLSCRDSGASRKFDSTHLFFNERKKTIYFPVSFAVAPPRARSCWASNAWLVLFSRAWNVA